MKTTPISLALGALGPLILLALSGCTPEGLPPPMVEEPATEGEDVVEVTGDSAYIYAPDEDVKNLWGFQVGANVNLLQSQVAGKPVALGLGGEFTGAWGSTWIMPTRSGAGNLAQSASTSPMFDVDLDRYVYVFGPQISILPARRFKIFGHALFGGVHDETEVSSGSFHQSASADAFAMKFGGGLEWRFAKHWSWRIIQADYLATNFSSPSGDWQDNCVISSGLTFGFGGKESPRTVPYSGKEPPTSAK